MDNRNQILDRVRLYRNLISDFVSDRISAIQFEDAYLTAFKQERVHFPNGIFDVLDGLFADVDSFCPEASLRGPDDLDARQLKERAEKALRDLNDARFEPE
jgi:hypothetical protein